MGGGRTSKKRGAGAAGVAEAAALATAKAGAEGVLAALSHIQPEELQHVMDEIEAEVASRVKRLRLACEHHALSLRNAFHVELMRIPKGVRQMSLKAFSEQYGQDVRSVMRLAVEEEASRVAAEQQQQGKATAAAASGAKGVPVTGTVVKASKGPGTARASRSRNGRGASRSGSSTGGGDGLSLGGGGGGMATRGSLAATSSASAAMTGLAAQTPMGAMGRSTRSGRVRGVAQTPMMKFDPRLPTTPGIRAPRYGESIMSVNGSPLQVPLAAITGASNGEDAGPVCPGTVARAALGKGKESPTLVLEIPTSGGESVDLLRDPEALASMGDEMKADVASKIERLQSGLASLLQTIGGGLWGGGAGAAGGGGGGGGKSN